MKKSLGFTLAEVLITLGIIGVVAAMTMPTLMNSTQGAQYKAAYKKALSAISQAVTLNVALEEYSFADTVAGDADTDYTVAKIITSRMNVVKTTEDGFGYDMQGTGDDTATDASDVADAAANNYTFFFNDGVVFSYDKANAFACTQDAPDAANNKICTGVIDVNGAKGPNKIVVCNDGNQNATNCEVKTPTDIYPVMFYDQTVLPNSDAARAVLYSK